jgi:hypothetical protein
MRVLWTLFKIIIGLAVAIPVGILVLAMTAGVLGTLISFAMLALRLACIGLVGYGLFRVAAYFFAPALKRSVPPVRDLPPADPYYEAAVRELDSELRGPARR